MGSADGAAALRELMFEVFRLNGAIQRHGARLTAPVGQTQARWQVLGAVADSCRTVPQIARQMGMTRQSVQRVTDLLVNEELLSFEKNPDHARSPLVRLTPRGRRLERQLAEVGVRWSESVATGMSFRDLERAVRVVRELTRRLDEGVP